jgi:hypothetical protein
VNLLHHHPGQRPFDKPEPESVTVADLRAENGQLRDLVGQLRRQIHDLQRQQRARR